MLFEKMTKNIVTIPESEQEPADEKEFGLCVEIEEEVFKKVMHWIDKAPGEVSGLGKVVHDAETNVLRVVDAMLLPQKNTGASTEIDGQAIAKEMYLTKDSPGELRWWWHSHVNMDVFWSSTDVATIKMLGANGWFLNTVFNKKREMKTAFCQAAPIRMIVDDIETDVLEVIDEDKAKQWDAEFEENCKHETPNYGQYFTWKDFTKKEEPTVPDLADIFPQEDMSADDMIAYLDLDELHDLYQKGEINESVWDRAINEASDEEINEFFEERGFDVGGKQ